MTTPLPHDAAGAMAHDHDFLGATHDANARRTRLVVLLTATMMVGEIIAGYATGSMALLADGFHMATHAGALGVAALAMPMPAATATIPPSASAPARSVTWRALLPLSSWR
jgi:Co/Zn/Cd efflux system component